MNRQSSRFLTIPVELRELIYDIVFQPTASVRIAAAPQRQYEYNPSTESDSTTWPADFESWAITHHPRSSQLLRVCSQLYAEGLSFLYSFRSFDLTARESPKLLLHNITPRCFSHIRHVAIEWEALQSFAWDLSKDDYRLGMAGLRCIQLANYRIRHLHGPGVKWRNVRSLERSMLQAAIDITEKHERLKVVAEEQYRRRASSSVGITSLKLSSLSKVRWRFITVEDELRDGEEIVNIQKDLEIVKLVPDDTVDDGFSLPAIDPF